MTLTPFLFQFLCRSNDILFIVLSDDLTYCLFFAIFLNFFCTRIGDWSPLERRLSSFRMLQREETTLASLVPSHTSWFINGNTTPVLGRCFKPYTQLFAISNLKDWWLGYLRLVEYSMVERSLRHVLWDLLRELSLSRLECKCYFYFLILLRISLTLMIQL